jgi:DNA-binding NarL/FixJ family response regulator
MPGSSRSTIRVLIADMPATLADIIAGLVAGEADMTVIGKTATPEETLALVSAERPDVVVLRASGQGGLAEALLLTACAGAKVLAIELDGAGGLLHELRPRRLALAEFSAARLIEAMRPAA